MNDSDNTADLLLKNSLESLRIYTEIFARQIGEFVKEQNLWVAKLVTVSSAILAGFLLSQRVLIPLQKIAILLLLLVVTSGLLIAYRANRSYMDALIEAYGRSADYNMRCLIYSQLATKSSLTQDELSLKTELESYFVSTFREMGILSEGKKLGSIYEKLKSDRKPNIANYLLIVGFFVAGVILTFATEISVIVGSG